MIEYVVRTIEREREERAICRKFALARLELFLIVVTVRKQNVVAVFFKVAEALADSNVVAGRGRMLRLVVCQ